MGARFTHGHADCPCLPVASRLMLQVASWLDYVTGISTAVAAIGTLGAVAVSLYLAVWQARQRRPSLSIEIYEGQSLGLAGTRGSDGLRTYGAYRC